MLEGSLGVLTRLSRRGADPCGWDTGRAVRRGGETVKGQKYLSGGKCGGKLAQNNASRGKRRTANNQRKETERRGNLAQESPWPIICTERSHTEQTGGSGEGPLFQKPLVS